jgi:hypothetical protein
MISMDSGSFVHFGGGSDTLRWQATAGATWRTKVFRRLTTAWVAAALGCWALPGQAQQIIELSLRAEGGFTRTTFSFGANPFVDGASPAQTGAVSNPGFAVSPGISNLLNLNPTAHVLAQWDAASMTPLNGNGTGAAFLGGSSLSLTLPMGVEGEALVLSNSMSGFAFAGIADNAREVTSQDFVFLPGTADLAQISADGAFSGAGLRVQGAPQAPVIVDLLADPMFRATYNGRGDLASLTQLVVRIQPAEQRTLAAIGLGLVDRDGDALSSLLPPQELDLDPFEPAVVSLRFTGNATLRLSQDDYASPEAFTSARSFWAASGFTGVGIEEYAGWTAAPIPEPGGLFLMLAGLAAVCAVRRRHRVSVAAALLLSASAASANQYRIIDLLPGTSTASSVWDVNNLGQVAGSFDDGNRQRGFVWDGGRFSFYDGLPGAVSSTAFAISDTGTVVGSDLFEAVPGSGVLTSRGWVHDGQNYAPFTRPGALRTELRGISPDGRWISGLADETAFLLDTLTGSELVTSGAEDTWVIPQGINAAGIHVGSLNRLGPSRVSYRYDISSQTRTSVVVDGFPNLSFRDINAAGTFAGWGSGVHPETGAETTIGVTGTPASATAFLVPGSGYTLLQGINDAGWLSGVYGIEASGSEVGFVAIPVPEPSTVMLLLAGLTVVACSSRRRNRVQAITPTATAPERRC